MVFLCNPNNPTGQYLGREVVRELLRRLPDGLLVLDEAYVGFVSAPWRSLDLLDEGNLLVLRSMTKDYALAGLRLGYAVAGEEIARVLAAVAPPWNVNAAAQAAGLAVLEEGGDYLAGFRGELQRAKRFLVEGLSALGLDVLPSETHYFLVRVGDGARLRAALLERGMLVRPTCAPQYYRIARQRGGLPGVRHGAGDGPGKLHAMTRGCLGGVSFCFVSHVGELQPCGYLQIPCGNVRKEGFAESWKNSPVFRKLRDPGQYKGKCGRCEYIRVCGGCRARAYAASGDYMSPEPYCPYTPSKGDG